MTEYEFTLPDGSKAYEIIDRDAGFTVMRQVKMFRKMHGAVSARPVPQHPPQPKGKARDNGTALWKR